MKYNKFFLWVAMISVWGFSYAAFPDVLVFAPIHTPLVDSCKKALEKTVGFRGAYIKKHPVILVGSALVLVGLYCGWKYRRYMPILDTNKKDPFPLPGPQRAKIFYQKKIKTIFY